MPMTARFDELKATDRLPSPTGVGLEILRLTQNEETTVQELSRTLQTDPALAGRILKLANSVQFGGSRTSGCVDDAVVRLGFGAVRNVALGFSLLSAQRNGDCTKFDYEKYWARSLAAAIASQMLSAHSRAVTAVDGYTCGLLSRIGRLALACVYPEEYSQILTAAADERPGNLVGLEQEQFATDHNELGAAMLLDWRLPNIFAVAIQHHEQPQDSGLSESSRDMKLTKQIHLANLMAGVCVAGEDERPIFLSELQAASGILDLDEDKLTEFSEQVNEQWLESAKALGLATEFASPAAKADCQVQPPSADSGTDGGQNPTEIAPNSSANDRYDPGGDQLESLRILVVEDEAITLRRLEKYLSESGHTVTTATGGRDGLRLALETKPQLVITDWMMPEMDGLEFCRVLRRSDAGRQMYIIVLTSCGADESLQAFEAGADDYVIKPFRPNLLEGRLHAGMRVVQLQEELAREKEKIDRQVAELAVANRMLQKVALTDALTGLPNRRSLMDRLAEEWDEASRHGRALACLMLDIDHFKRVNDVHGHDAGDEVLRDTAQVLKKQVRRYDVPARSGGEEFVVICPGVDLEHARGIADRVRAAVEANTVAVANGPELNVTVSIGAAALSDDVANPDALIKAADEAMYAAKNAGRNRVCLAASPNAEAILNVQLGDEAAYEQQLVCCD